MTTGGANPVTEEGQKPSSGISSSGAESGWAVHPGVPDVEMSEVK